MIHCDTLVDDLLELHNSLDDLAADVDEGILLAPKMEFELFVFHLLLELLGSAK